MILSYYSIILTHHKVEEALCWFSCPNAAVQLPACQIPKYWFSSMGHLYGLFGDSVGTSDPTELVEDFLFVFETKSCYVDQIGFVYLILIFSLLSAGIIGLDHTPSNTSF
jgi:hypothetical protein